MTLTPIRRAGATSLYYVAPADFVGVELAPTGSTDHTGLNEATDWTKRLYDTLTVEHYATGVHNSIRTARALVLGYYDGVTYQTMAGSYCQSTAGVRTVGAGAATIVPGVGAGEIAITLAHAMPSSTYRLKDATFALESSTLYGTRVHVMRLSITSTTVFNVKRWEGADFDTLTATAGAFVVAVHDA